MPKKRLTREESRELTRRRLVDAAAEVIPQTGYPAATVEEIAETAGYSRGAFYSNFKTKDELFLALMRQVADVKHEMVSAIFDEGGTPEALFERLRAFYAIACRQRGYFLLWSEAKMHATRDAEFRKGLNELDRETRTHIAGYVARYYEETGITPPTAPESIALALVALADGMALIQMLDPEAVPQDIVESVMMQFFDSVTR